MTGWRMGYAVSCRDVAKQLSKSQEPTTLLVLLPAMTYPR